MTDIDGQIKYHCDYVKEKKIKLSIIYFHIQLMIKHFNNFNDMIYNKKEFENIFIYMKNQLLIFLIISQSEFACYYNHKRIIILYINKK